MSDTKTPLTSEQVERVGGGLDCSADQIFEFLGRLTEGYESLVEFSSHVIERVINSTN